MYISTGFYSYTEGAAGIFYRFCRSFNVDPSYLTLNYGFPVIRLLTIWSKFGCHGLMVKMLTKEMAKLQILHGHCKIL